MANIRNIPYKDMMLRELQLAAYARGVKSAKSIKNRKKLISMLEDDYYFLVKNGGLVKVKNKGVKPWQK